MFDIGIFELVVIALVAVGVAGPDRLPELARQAGQVVRRLRAMVQGVERELRSGLGPDFAELDVRDLDPRRALKRHVLDPLSGEVGDADDAAEIDDPQP
jgi:sec-independent protein translocase protein TatB